MPITETHFHEPIYTRRDKFNHIYDITLNEISNNSDKQGFSNFGYCSAILQRLHDLSCHEKLLFLKHQLKASPNPMRWLLDLEKLLEVNSWETAQEFNNQYENILNDTKPIISDLFREIDHGNYSTKLDNTEGRNSNNDIIYSTEEACEFLNISKSTMYKLTSSKSIPFSKPGGKNMYFLKSELEKFLLGKRQITNCELETQTNDYLARNFKY
ncbi:helix-turn-helix domain-containing protein [Corallibacter sp.]|uniref:helix-turn-helix domain-containing protein n=1 Tax=Corallibacter sp. TaxID=2038084 RepID=UPI003AB1D974